MTTKINNVDNNERQQRVLLQGVNFKYNNQHDDEYEQRRRRQQTTTTNSLAGRAVYNLQNYPSRPVFHHSANRNAPRTLAPQPVWCRHDMQADQGAQPSLYKQYFAKRGRIGNDVGQRWHQTDEGYVAMSGFFFLWTGLHTRLNGRQKHTSLGMPVCHFFSFRWTIPYKLFY